MRSPCAVLLLALFSYLSCERGDTANIIIEVIVFDGAWEEPFDAAQDDEFLQDEDAQADLPKDLEMPEGADEGQEMPFICVEDKECEEKFPEAGKCEKGVCEKGLCKLVLKENFELCDDNEQCTSGDFCYQGLCFGGENICKCHDDAYCSQFDDENMCNGVKKCLGGFCAIDPESVVLCDTSNDDDCKKTECDEASGLCVTKFAQDGTPCNDLNPCTLNNRCYNGICESDESLDCNDYNVCTGDYCDPLKGCVNEPLNEPCEDGNLCTEGDFCHGGECVSGSIKDCDDSNPCSDEFCNPAFGCLYINNTDPCSDESLCTSNDICEFGVCKGGKTILCDDGNPCTDDSCLPDKGCVFINNDANKCDDQNICTSNDFCANGKCVGTDNICTCVTDADCGQYENGDLCDGTLHCVGKKCVLDPSTIKVCDPSGDTDCLKIACHPQTGECVYKSEIDGTLCDDGSLCTVNNVCIKGECVGTQIICSDVNPCTDDYCDPLFGCIYKYNSLPCSDNNACTYGDTCTFGICIGKKLDCNDLNPCTDDYCVSDSGCKYAFNSKPCDDNNKCTFGDMCKAGHCVGASTLNCNDNDVCTTDKCDPAVGCQYEFNDLPCQDGNKCTQGDVCVNGNCVGGSTVNCEDGNLCTDNICVEPIGCVSSFNTKNCNDGNKCTDNDRCTNGVCTGTQPKDCSDQNPCTDDHCDPTAGCFHTFNNKACNDSDPCTTLDFCNGGTCIGTGELPCDDKLPCTTDTCNSTTGCVFFNTCQSPNPDCTPQGCLCGKTYCNPQLSDKCLSGVCFCGNLPGCDPLRADNCKGGKCYCGKESACKSPKKCVNGVCVSKQESEKQR